jgi:hypothetical protein
MALEPAAEPPEAEQLLVADRPSGLQHRVIQRRGMTFREDQMVATRILGRLKVELQVAIQQDRHQVGRRHRRGRMAGAASGAGAHRIDAQLLAQLAAKA